MCPQISSSSPTSSSLSSSVSGPQNNSGNTNIKQQRKSGAFVSLKNLSAEEAIKECIKYGHLTKQGQVMKTWRKRVFVLRGSNLFYYKSLKDKKCTGYIELKHCHISRADQELKRKFSISIQTPKRTFHLVASSEKDCASWLLNLTEASGESIIVSKSLYEKLSSHRLSSSSIPGIGTTRSNGSTGYASGGETGIIKRNHNGNNNNNSSSNSIIGRGRSGGGRGSGGIQFEDYDDDDDDDDSDTDHVQNPSNTIVPHNTEDSQRNIFGTISEAVEFASDGEKILIHPGVYKESIVISKAIQLIGTEYESINKSDLDAIAVIQSEYKEYEDFNCGSCSGVIIESVGESALVFKANGGKISNLTLRVLSSKSNEPISNPKQSNYSDANNDDDNAASGDDSGGDNNTSSSGGNTSSSSDNSGNSSSGNSGDSNTVSESNGDKDDNISAVNTAYCEHCACIEIDNGGLEIEECTISCEIGSGILAMNRSQVTINSCKIVKNQDIGIWLWDRATGDIHNSLISENGYDALRVSGEAMLSVVNNTIFKNELHGIMAEHKSKLQAMQNEIKLCKADGMRLTHECIVSIKENSISFCEEYGINVKGNCSGEIEYNVLKDNKFGDDIALENTDATEINGLLIAR